MSESAYHGIIVTPRMLATVLVQSRERKWYRFDLWEDRIFILDRWLEYRNWEEYDRTFTDESSDMFELHGTYKALYSCDAPANAHKKTLTKAIWAKYYLGAIDRTSTYSTGATRNNVTGERERKRSMDRRGYRALDVPSVENLPNQALIVHRELLKLHTQANKDIISEAEVIDLMNRLRDSGILKTKQDPFRIFQYYRPALLKANKLEFIE